MENEFIPYAEALALKELGFDEPCFYQYVRDFDNDGELIPIVNEANYPILRNNTQVSNSSGKDCFAAPLYQQAFRWFREKHELYGTIRYGNNEFDKSIYLFPCINGIISGNDSFETQEEAELECLKKLIKIIKNK